MTPEPARAPAEPAPGEPARAGARLDTALAFALALALYAATAARTIQGGDSAEFALTGAVGGVPHPPGYPLYALLSRLAYALLPGPPAWRVSLLSALCGAGAVALLQRACLRLTGDRAASLAAALAFALSPLAWKLAGVPEVFSLHALLAAALLLAALRLAEGVDPARRAVQLGLAAGLGLSNHHTLVLLAPLPLWALWALGRRHGARAAGRAAAWAALGGLAGLAPYAWLAVAGRAASPPAWVWGSLDSARGVLRHVLRAEYGTFRLGLLPVEREPLAHVGRMLGALPADLHLVYALAALAGLVAWARRARGSLAAALAAFALAGVALPALFNLPDTDLARAVAERFRLLPLLLCVPAAAFGLAALRRLLRARSRGRAPALLAALLLFGPLLPAARLALPRADWRSDATIERYTAAMLEGAEPGAVVLGIGDVLPAATEWLQHVHGLRRDVRMIDLNLLRTRWYDARVRRQLPDFPLPFDPTTTHLGALARGLAARGPVYATVWAAPLLAANVPVAQEGLLVRIAPPATRSLAEAEERLARATAALAGAAPADAWSASFRDAAAVAWERLGREAAAGGDVPLAARCGQAAAALR